jgi:hypothetical protein
MKRLFLDLSHTLTGESEPSADLVEGHRFFPIQAEIQSQNLGFTAHQTTQGALDLMPKAPLHHFDFRRFLSIIRQNIE